MLCGFFPDLIGHRVGPVADASERFGERQCGTLSLIKAGVVPPSRYSENALIALTRFLQIARMHINADAAAVDLTGTQLDKL